MATDKKEKQADPKSTSLQDAAKLLFDKMTIDRGPAPMDLANIEVKSGSAPHTIQADPIQVTVPPLQATAQTLLAANDPQYREVPAYQLTPEQLRQYAPEIDPTAPASAFGKVRIPIVPAPTAKPAHRKTHPPAGPKLSPFEQMRRMIKSNPLQDPNSPAPNLEELVAPSVRT